MTGTNHLAFVVDPRTARRTIARLDWPGATAASVDTFSFRRRWLPFNRETGASLLDKSRYKNLSSMAIPVKRLSMEAAATGPPAGKHLPPGSTHGDVLFVPCYLFREPAGGNGWAVTEGVSGKAIGGKLTVHRRAAAVRLCLIVFLALYAFFMATAFAHLILASVFSLAGPLLLLTGGFLRLIVAALLLVLLWMMLRWMMENRNYFLAALGEPIHRLETGAVRLPLDRGWLRVVWAAGMAGLILAALSVLSLLAQWVASTVAAGPALNVAAMLLQVVQLAISLVFGITAIKLSRGDWLRSPSPVGTGQDAARPSGAAADLVKALLNVVLFAMFGMIVGQILDLLGVGNLIRRHFQMEPGLLAGIGVRVGAIAGVIASEVSWHDRITLAVGFAAELVCELLFDPWVGIPVLLILVAVASRVNTGSRPSGPGSATPWWDAIRRAWLFVFGATLGGIAGSGVGLVLLGTTGMVVGELLGTSVLATVAVLIRRPSLKAPSGV